MNLKNEFQPIRDWSKERELFIKSNKEKHMLKLYEEAGELSKAILERDYIKIKDSIGDCIVVLTNIAYLSGFSVEECINYAYKEISNRKGKIINGTFVKNV